MNIRSALLFAYIEKYGSYVIALATTIVISRILRPEDIGAFAVGMALVGLVAVLREFGISTYIVQEQNLTDEHVRAAFTVTIALGVGFGVVVGLLAYPVSYFYSDDRIAEILLILALGFAITPLGSISQALLSREMRFDVLVWLRLTHPLVSGGVAITLAWLGFGPQSLAWAALAATLSNAALSLYARPHPMHINLTLVDLRKVVSVGLPATLVSIVDDLINTLPALVIGRTQGLGAAGLFSRATGLSQMSHQLIARAAGPVFFSAFSELRRKGLSVVEPYVNATACVCGLGWALLASLAVLSAPVVRLLFGPQWTAVAPLLPWLCAGAATALLTSGAHLLLMAHDGAKDALRAKLWSVPGYIACTLAGALIGLEALAIGLVLASVIASFQMARAVSVRVNIDLQRQLLPLRMSLGPALGSGLAAAPVAIWYEMTSPPAWVAVSSGGIAASIGGVIGLLATQNPLRAELQRLWARGFSPGH